MKTYVYTSGLDLLAEQESIATTLSFTGFKVSSSIPSDFVFDADYNTQPGTLEYTGGVSNMFYCPMTDNDVLIRCEILSSVSYLEVESIQLLVNDIPFCISLSPSVQQKLEDHDNSAVGTRYVYQLIFSLPELTSRISFANLDTKTAVFHTVDSESLITKYPWEEIHDQLFIKNHSELNTPLVVLNVFGYYWGCPLTLEYTDTDFFKISGGLTGDRSA